MVYSDVIDNKYHLLLPKKQKYTKVDYKKLVKLLPELSCKELLFIVICTAIHHDAGYSRFFHSPIKAMFNVKL